MRLPAEWEEHERTIMGWPCRAELWGSTIDRARAEYAGVANAIAAFEPVTMIANPGEEVAAARAACAAGVEVVELPLDDSWLRDCGPIYVRDGEHDGIGDSAGIGDSDSEIGRGRRVAVHFRFNAWGEKFPPWDRDAAVGRLVAERLGDEVREAPIVLEGGSILSNGSGTLVTTEECLLNPNRNPELDRDAIEAALRAHLGVQRIVWLGRGLVEDRDTDGHVDLIAALTGTDEVLLQTAPDGNPNHENCEENRARLSAAGFRIIELPFLPYVDVAGETVVAGYLNLYVCNGAVIVPVTGASTDQEALEIIAGAFPERQVVPVPGAVIAYGGGGPHCITQQVPRA